MQIIMPKLGLTMTQGTIAEWLRTTGDFVKAGEVLFCYESEKVSLDYEAPADGVLGEILAPAGSTVPCGAPVCEFQAARETPSRGHMLKTGAAAAGLPPARPSLSPMEEKTMPVKRVEATPKARGMAAQWGIPLNNVNGRGPGGRVQAADVDLARAQVTPSATGITPRAGRGMPHEAHTARAEEVIPLTGIRQVVARRMSESAFTAPHVTLFTEAEATNLVSARAQLNQKLSPEDKLSYNALLAALTARALREHPLLNARLAPDGIHLLPEINLALAVDTGRGLMTPVLRGADRLSLPAIQRGYGALIERALTGAALPDDFTGGTFTITNLGAWDVDGFTPIINPPQAAILGVGRIVEKAVARAGEVVARPMLTLSLSFDHRIVDGATAARFLQRVKQLVERPLALLLT